MGMLSFIALCASIFANPILGQAIKIPSVFLDTPENSVCPPESQLQATKANITNNISEILSEYAAGITVTYTIAECEGSGWRRVALLNMTDNQTCPDQWRLYQQDSVRACGRQASVGASCDSVLFSANDHVYTQVCGRARAYQYASPDAGFGDYYAHIPGNEINEPYVDGLSITQGNPRQHIWSLYGAVFDNFCCDEQAIDAITSLNFIGNNYFCDTSNPNDETWMSVFFTDHLLWDGLAQCPNNPTCCAPSSGPWFHSTLTTPSMSDIEVRICGDEGTDNEDTPLELLEIYVK